MQCLKLWMGVGGLGLILALLQPALAAAPPAVVLAVTAANVSAVSSARTTTALDITLSGRVRPALAGRGAQLTVLLPQTVAGASLAPNVSGGGLISSVHVEQIALDAVPTPAVRLVLQLRVPARAALVPGPDARTVRVTLQSDQPFEPPVAALPPSGPTLYTLNAYQSDVAGLLRSLARDAEVSVVLPGGAARKVSVSLRQVPLETAFSLLAKAGGLAWHRDGETYVFGEPKEVETAYPAPVVPAGQQVYHCRHISAPDLVASLEKTFGKENLTVALGASPSQARLGASGFTGLAGEGLKAGAAQAAAITRDIILTGQPTVVAQALALAEKLDARRKQVRIGVKITDISMDGLKELGVQWTFGGVSLKEKAPASGLSFGSFTRAGLSFDATLSALEQRNNAKLLAAPTLSLLDGERGSILIGDKLQFPVLVNSIPGQGQTFDIRREDVGISLEVAMQMESDDEMTLTILPKVSVVTGFLNVNGGSYPQISTREQETTIRARDGQQIVIGGLIRDDEIRSSQNVPILSNLPFFGELFKYRKTTHRRSEVVVVITPEILKD